MSRSFVLNFRFCINGFRIAVWEFDFTFYIIQHRTYVNLTHTALRIPCTSFQNDNEDNEMLRTDEKTYIYETHAVTIDEYEMMLNTKSCLNTTFICIK